MTVLVAVLLPRCCHEVVEVMFAGSGNRGEVGYSGVDLHIYRERRRAAVGHI